ncbi:MAG: FAD-dependent oxidoreductase [Bacteroidota bacterium]
MNKEYDYIIVGQGFAGTSLANELLKLNKRVLVFDAPQLPSSTMVSGGLFNPITGRKMVLTWLASELFPFLHKFYKDLEERLGGKYLYNIPLYRPFLNTEELNDWQGKWSDARYSEFIEKVYSEPILPEFFKNNMGGIMLKHAGYLDNQSLFIDFRNFLREKEIFVEEEFLTENINYESDSIVYNEYSAKKVILCTGPAGFGNKLLNDIRFQPLKGEALRLKIEYNTNIMINRNGFVLPRDGMYVAGATYNRHSTTWEPSEEGKQEVMAKIDKLLNTGYEIIDQIAGLRPTTHDRRPVVGFLPDQPQIGVFNGLGSKGSTLAPFFANQFANHMVNGSDIYREVRIERYFK